MRTRSIALVLAVVASVLAVAATTTTASAATFTGVADADGPSWRTHLVDLQVGDVITGTLTWTGDANLNLFLRDPSGTKADASFSLTEQPEVVTATAHLAGEWLLGVKAASGRGDYSLDVAVDGGDFTGSVSPDATWSSHDIDVVAGEEVTVDLSWAGDADLNLFFRDPSGTGVEKSVKRDTNAESTTHVAATSGTYLIGVKARTGAADYRVDLTRTPPATGGPLGTDWPMWQRDVTNTGTTPDEQLSTANVDTLGLAWQANVGAKAFTSPAVVYEPRLGKTIAYVGRQNGEFVAYDAVTGIRQWTFVISKHIQSSPAVVDGVVYFGASDNRVYALDAATGDVLCSYLGSGVVSASPVVADLDGNGLTIYVGENGVTGSDDGGTMYAIAAVDPDDGVADCSLRWSYDNFGDPEGDHQGESGSWSPPSVATDVNGRHLVVFGGSSPDNAFYALDAITGERVWRVQTVTTNLDQDVGAGPTITAPGVNGFVDGVVYVIGKNRIMHAVNLRTGATIWEYSLKADFPSATTGTVSTAALHGRNLVVGYADGLVNIDPITGTKKWASTEVDPQFMVFSSPTIAGPDGAEVVFSSDAFGRVLATDLATGLVLWQYQTGDFIYGSPVVVGEYVFVAGADGFMYAFIPGGGQSGKPTTAIDAPLPEEELENTGTISSSGSASDEAGVASVKVSVKNRNSNQWWSDAENRWVNGYTENDAVVSAPGGTDVTWTYDLPAPAAGGPFFLQAVGVDTDGQYDPSIDSVRFTIDTLGDPPETTVDVPEFKEIFHFDERVEFPITVSGTATDTEGDNPGVQRVRIVIKNREHEEFYCGGPGCSGGPDTGHGSNEWTPTYTVLEAELDNPGGTSTNWSYTFNVYDHPHSYSVIAWAQDLDGEFDVSRAANYRFCTRDPGNNFCA